MYATGLWHVLRIWFSKVLISFFQITIPAQPGHPNSAPKALTVQVPAHALHPGTPSSAILQQVLTQAITQALNLPDVMQAALFLQSQINSAFKLEPVNN
jgi:hypothetical protein